MPDSTQATSVTRQRVRRLLTLAAELWLESDDWASQQEFLDDAKTAFIDEMGRF